MKYFFLLFLIFFQGSDNIIIKNAWVRPAPKTFNTACYCTVINKGNEPDTLYKAASTISSDVEIHETYKKGDMMGMRQIKILVIAPKDSLVFKPGSYHIMLMNLDNNIVINHLIDISLFFKTAGEIVVKAKVASN